MKMENIVNITDNAVNRIYELIAEEGNFSLKLRIFVQGGGCSGFKYGFTFDEDQNEDDFSWIQEANGNKVSFLIDSMSIQYLNGATVDFTEDLNGTQFVIKNPNVSTSCGCGSSFSV